MDKEEELEKKLEEYRALHAENKQVDLAALAMFELEKQGDFLPSGLKMRAYIISFLFPPFGLIFAVKFYLSSQSDAKRAAYICIGLTAASIIFGLIILRLIFSSVGSSNLEQIEQINPQDLQDLLK